MLCSVFVTAHTEAAREAARELVDALTSLSIDATTRDDALVVDGNRLALAVDVRAHPTPAELAQLVATASARPAVVIADRISGPGRDVLRSAGWGWLDRRGHVRIWAPGVRVESPLPEDGSRPPAHTANPWTTVGLETAVAALLRPDEPVTARRVAPLVGRSVGAVHESVARFSEIGLVGSSTRLPLLPELFWETAAHWPDDGWIALPVGIEEVAEKAGAGALIRVDERAATLGGARIPAAGDLPARCYVPRASVLRRVRSLADRLQPTLCWVRTAPVRWLPDNLDHPPTDVHPWRVAHPLVCALRLAADPARGQEVVESWGIVPGARS